MGRSQRNSRPPKMVTEATFDVEARKDWLQGFRKRKRERRITGLAHGALKALEKLFLDDNKIGDVGLQALSDKLSKGALNSVTRLDLQHNQIGDVGMSALAEAVSKGALAPGAHIYLMGNQATETGNQAVRDAVKARGLRVSI